MRWKNLASLAVALLAWTITVSSVPARQETVAPPNGNPETNSLALTLSTDKQTYRINEPIYFTFSLRNGSSNGLWVGKSIVFADVPGTFVMTVTDAQEKPVHGDMVYFAGSLGDFKREDLFDWIRKTRLVLCPGCFLGMAAKLQDYRYDLSAPGKYRLQVSYSDIGYKEIEEEGVSINKIKRLKQQAIFPLWSGSIKSPDVWIEVVR